MPRNTELVENVFGFCITNYNEYGDFKQIIIINMENCNRVRFTEREMTSIVFHELGHLLNLPESIQEPNFLFCFTNGFDYNKSLHEEIKAKNSMNQKIYAD